MGRRMEVAPHLVGLEVGRGFLQPNQKINSDKGWRQGGAPEKKRKVQQV